MLTFLILSAIFIITALLTARLLNAIVSPISKAIGNFINKAAERRDEQKRAEMKEKALEREAKRSAQNTVEGPGVRTEGSDLSKDLEENYNRSEGVESEVKNPEAANNPQAVEQEGSGIRLFGSVDDIAAAIRRDIASGKLEGYLPRYDEFGHERPRKTLDLSAYIFSGGTVIKELKIGKNGNLAPGKVGMFLDRNMIYNVKLIAKEITSSLRQRGLTFRPEKGIVANFQSEVLNPAFSTARNLYRGAWNGVFKPMWEKGIRPAARTLAKAVRNAFTLGRSEGVKQPAAATVPTIREAERSPKEYVKTRRSGFDFARVMDFAQSTASVADDRFTAKSMSKDVSQTQKTRQKTQKDKGRKGPKQG